MSFDMNPPQSMSAYVKWRHLNWIPDIPIIKDNGRYTVYPHTTNIENNAFRIYTDSSTTEYFVVEYRSTDTGLIDSGLPGSGLLVSRVNTAAGVGNLSGAFELYIYRPDGTLQLGDIWDEYVKSLSAYFSYESGRTEINANTNPTPFLSNGNQGGLNIFNISSAGESISFEILFMHSPNSLLASQFEQNVTLHWTAPDQDDHIIGYNVYRGDIFLGTVPSDQFTFVDFDVPRGSYTYQVSSVYKDGESFPISLRYNVTEFVLITEYPFNENFSNSVTLPIGWSVHDNDGDGRNWFVSSLAIQALQGGRYMESWSAMLNAQALTPDNWLITPKFYLDNIESDTHFYELIYHVGTRSIDAFAEHYSILISTESILRDTDGTLVLSGFENVYSFVLTTNEYTRKTLNIDQYRGQSIHIAFRHHDVSGIGQLKLDDITVWVNDGTTSETDKVELPSLTSLLGNFPNPFNPETIIRYQVSAEMSEIQGSSTGMSHSDRSEHVQIMIYNIRGQRIRALVNEVHQPGQYSVIWDGRDDDGNNVGNGVYLYRMTAGDIVKTRRMLLLK
jgi:hypothetical protein